MKISYEHFQNTCSTFSKNALGVVTSLSKTWEQDPDVEPVPALYDDDALGLIFYDAMAEFLMSTVEIEEPS